MLLNRHLTNKIPSPIAEKLGTFDIRKSIGVAVPTKCGCMMEGEQDGRALWIDAADIAPVCQ